MEDKILRVCICGHGMQNNLIKELMKINPEIYVIMGGLDVELNETNLNFPKLYLQTPIEPYEDSDDKFNWIESKIDNKLIKNYNNTNILLKTKYNRRNKFKNKRR